ncbi:hypothetical protein LIA77_06633 [Sarocladium implicatum]|nr:hypothetical protein LIA77_06633 [Sarocladium implicatum]
MLTNVGTRRKAYKVMYSIGTPSAQAKIFDRHLCPPNVGSGSNILDTAEGHHLVWLSLHSYYKGLDTVYIPLLILYNDESFVFEDVERLLHRGEQRVPVTKFNVLEENCPMEYNAMRDVAVDVAYSIPESARESSGSMFISWYPIPTPAMIDTTWYKLSKDDNVVVSRRSEVASGTSEVRVQQQRNGKGKELKEGRQRVCEESPEGGPWSELEERLEAMLKETEEGQEKRLEGIIRETVRLTMKEANKSNKKREKSKRSRR